MKGDNISFRYTLKNVRIVLKYGGNEKIYRSFSLFVRNTYLFC